MKRIPTENLIELPLYPERFTELVSAEMPTVQLDETTKKQCFFALQYPTKYDYNLIAAFPTFIIRQAIETRDRYAVVTYHYRSGGTASWADPIPLFDTTITREQAEAFKKDLPAMYKFCQEKLAKEK